MRFAEVWEVDGELLSQIIGALQVKMGDDDCPTDVFFTDCIPVPPSKYRPVSVTLTVSVFRGRGLLPPATKLGQGNVFTGVCDSVHRGST